MVGLRDSVSQVLSRLLLDGLRVFSRLLLIGAVFRFSGGLSGIRHLGPYRDEFVKSRCALTGPTSRHFTRLVTDLFTCLVVFVFCVRVGRIRRE